MVSQSFSRSLTIWRRSGRKGPIPGKIQQRISRAAVPGYRVQSAGGFVHSSSFGWWDKVTAMHCFIRIPWEKAPNAFFSGRPKRWQ